MPKERKLQTGATDPVPIWGTTCVNSFREIPEQDCKLNCTNFVLILSSFSQQFLNWTLDRLEWSQSWVDSGKVARLVNGQGESQVAGSRLFQLSGKISAKIRNLQNSLFKEACVMQQWCKKKRVSLSSSHAEPLWESFDPLTCDGEMLELVSLGESCGHCTWTTWRRKPPSATNQCESGSALSPGGEVWVYS